MSTTIKKINDALKRHGFNGEIVRGDGYHYFVGDDFDHAYSSSIPVMYTSHLTIDECLHEAEKVRTESRERAEDAAESNADFLSAGGVVVLH